MRRGLELSPGLMSSHPKWIKDSSSLSYAIPHILTQQTGTAHMLSVVASAAGD